MSPFVVDLLFWIAVVACSIAELAIIRSAVVAPLARVGGLPNVRRAPEVLWAVLPALALAVLFVITWRERHP